MKTVKPDCWKCKWLGECECSYVRCLKHDAIVKGNIYSVRIGSFEWPESFRPQDLIACDSFEPKGKQ